MAADGLCKASDVAGGQQSTTVGVDIDFVDQSDFLLDGEVAKGLPDADRVCCLMTFVQS